MLVAVLSHFVAPDIRRDIEIVDAAYIESGFIVARVRTWTVLYASRGIVPEDAFGNPQLMSIDGLWTWDDASWGGSVPDEPKF